MRKTLTLQRARPRSPGYPVLGSLTADALSVVTLEDPYIFGQGIVHEHTGHPEARWPYTGLKLPGVTAIPAGRYRVHVSVSARFGGRLPLLDNVPGFTGIRIHAGNVAENTEGCILVGDSVAPDQRGVVHSNIAMVLVQAWFSANEAHELWIEVKNP